MTSSLETVVAPMHSTEELLRELVARGFQFLHPRSEGGEIVAVVGVWAHHNVVDVMWLRSEEDARAVRMPGDEPNILAPTRVLWESEGDARDVLGALLSLPEDFLGDLADLASSKGCWVPVASGRAKWLATAS